jgi:hypothetical protein
LHSTGVSVPGIIARSLILTQVQALRQGGNGYPSPTYPPGKYPLDVWV